MGKFSFYINENKVGEANNIVTDLGKVVIGNYLSETRPSWADSIAIGAGGSSPSASDLSLDLEFFRESIDLKSYSVTDNKIVIRGTFPGSVVGKIYEVGVYSTTSPTEVSSSGPLIAAFDKSAEDWSAGQDEESLNRVGLKSFRLVSSEEEVSSSLRFFGNLRAYNQNSVFRLGYLASGSTGSVFVRIKSDNINFREYSFQPNTSGAYSVESWSLSDFNIFGGAGILEFFDIEVAVSGEINVVFDALSVVDESAFELDDVLVSRAVIDQNGLDFINKLPARELQIEYEIDLNDGAA
jgi:hypothetical protein